ncbi:E3 ubiquitin-protein ligase RNF170-like isoform X1 [Olea europaea var. sylvestris]|uniref:E3 ubiquitin-protein ligase RNF170-like isoform X1 n=1 Tax=Olea europaea var. sylvestris TaxID=158386 RepID=UPI000C1D69FA|nr:E3 ubiquitin-protein ligase RNF170-like isoform X1 [Olea europaea var. sylvestris]
MERNYPEVEQQNGNNFDERYKGDGPPTDDVCPICLDLFTVPCRSNCTHWFCANCILQFWMYISVIQQCKCPLCSLPITNLVLEMSQLVQPGEDVEEVIRKVKHYNRLFVGGLDAFFLKVLMLPDLIKKVFRFLMDLEALTCDLCVMRFLGLLLILFYGMKEFQLISIGAFGILKIFDVGANLLLASLFVYHMWQRWELRGLERRLADLQLRNALIDLQQWDALIDLQQWDALVNLEE